MKVWMLVLALFISQFSFALEELKFHEGGENIYVVEINSSKYLGEIKGLEIIKRAGTEKCGEMPAHFGKYRFQGSENLSGEEGAEETFRIIQELFCGELPAAAQEAEKTLTEKEKHKLEGQAKKSAEMYLNYLMKSDFKNAYSLLSDVTKAGKTYNEWLETRKYFTAPTGDLVKSDIWGITTYLNPPSSERKGVFIATDFEREYSDSMLYCGYLVWYLEADKLRVIREDVGVIDLKKFKEKTKELITLKAKLRCKSLVSGVK